MAIIISDWGKECDMRYRFSFIEENPSDRSICQTLDLVENPVECQFVLIGMDDLVDEVWGDQNIQETLELYFKPEDPICTNTIYCINPITGNKNKVPKSKIWE